MNVNNMQATGNQNQNNIPQQNHYVIPQPLPHYVYPYQQQQYTPVLSRRARRQIFKGQSSNESAEIKELKKKVNVMQRKMYALPESDDRKSIPKKVNVLSELKVLQNKVHDLEAKQTPLPKLNSAPTIQEPKQPKPVDMTVFMQKVLNEMKAMDEKLVSMAASNVKPVVGTMVAAPMELPVVTAPVVTAPLVTPVVATPVVAAPVVAAPVVAAPEVAAPVVAATVPWYRKLWFW